MLVKYSKGKEYCKIKKYREWKHVIKTLPFKKCYSLIQKTFYTQLADFYSNIADIVFASIKYVS